MEGKKNPIGQLRFTATPGPHPVTPACLALDLRWQGLLLALHDADVLDERDPLEPVEEGKKKNTCGRLPGGEGLEEDVVGGNQDAVARSIGEVDLQWVVLDVKQACARGREGVADLVLEGEEASGVVELHDDWRRAAGRGGRRHLEVASGRSCRVEVDCWHVHPDLEELHDDGVTVGLWTNTDDGRAQDDFGGRVGS